MFFGNWPKYVEGTVDNLNAGEWWYGDSDELTYSTIYVRLDSGDGPDPDDEPVDFVIAGHSWGNYNPRGCTGDDQEFYVNGGLTNGEEKDKYCWERIESSTSNFALASEDRSGPNGGDQYWRNNCGLKTQTEAEIRYPNNDSMRIARYVTNDTEWSPCHTIPINDGTELWYGYSVYITDDPWREWCGGLRLQMWDNDFKGITLDVNMGGTSGNGCGGYDIIRGKYWKGVFDVPDNPDTPKYTYINSGIDIDDLLGTWVDLVIQIRGYTENNADTTTKLWINGQSVVNLNGLRNVIDIGSTTGMALEPLTMYHAQSLATYSGGITTWNRHYDTYGDVPRAEWQFDGRDEFRIAVQEGGKGTYNYCDVAPPIWAETPSISHPSEGETNLGTTFNASFTDFSPHRVDLQGCFPAYRMQVEVREDGEVDWETLAFSALVSSSNTVEVSGLNSNTTHQMRVRHSSYNSDTTTQYWGEWSTVIEFSTDLPTDPEPSLSLGGLEVGGNTALETDGNTDLAIP